MYFERGMKQFPMSFVSAARRSEDERRWRQRHMASVRVAWFHFEVCVALYVIQDDHGPIHVLVQHSKKIGTKEILWQFVATTLNVELFLRGNSNGFSLAKRFEFAVLMSYYWGCQPINW